MFAYSFLAMTSYNILKPVTGRKFIDQLGADNLPYVQLAVGFAHRRADALVQRRRPALPRRRVIPVTQAAIVVLLVRLLGAVADRRDVGDRRRFYSSV